MTYREYITLLYEAKQKIKTLQKQEYFNWISTTSLPSWIQFQDVVNLDHLIRAAENLHLRRRK